MGFRQFVLHHALSHRILNNLGNVIPNGRKLVGRQRQEIIGHLSRYRQGFNILNITLL